MALTDKLSAIGNAIREKAGTTALMTLDEMPTAIGAIETGGGGGEGLPEEAFIITGDCSYRFSFTGWNWFLENYGNKITTTLITNANRMFYKNDTLTEIPFDINLSLACPSMDSLFEGMSNLTSISSIKRKQSAGTVYALPMSYLFSGCAKLREIPNNFFNDIDSESNWENLQTKTDARQRIFQNCYSLRKLPDVSKLKNKASSAYSIYYYGFTNCYALDEIVNLPVLNITNYTSNLFIGGFDSCYRVKNLIFETNEDGTPLTAQWKTQTIDLSKYVGYSEAAYKFTGADSNSGITTAKVVNSEETYQALKDDPDWYATNNTTYCRYNHDSAVATINSLPDTSAYLAEKGGTNTIKFKGACGSGTDGGAINTLTAEEIAVATAKGWTVSLA